MRIIKIGILYFIFVLLNSCEPKKPYSSFDRIVNQDSIEIADSTNDVNSILKAIRTQSFPQFENVKPVVVRDSSITEITFQDSLIRLQASYFSNSACKNWNIDYLKRNLSSIWEGGRNGKMLVSGKQLTNSGTKIGMWRYQDSTVDYDKNFNVNYQDVVMKAEKHGWKEKEIQIGYFGENTDGKNPFWQITYSDSAQNIFLRVDAITGKEKYSKEGMLIINFTDVGDSSKVTHWVW